MVLKALKSRKRTVEQRKFDYIDYVIILDYNTEKTYYRGKEQSVIADWIIFEDGVKKSGYGMDEMMAMLHAFNTTLDDKSCYRAKVFVRNASYFFQFVRDYYDFSREKILAVNEHKLIHFSMGKIDFQCLTYHSNMKMKEYCNKYSSYPYNEDNLEERCLSMRSALMNEMKAENDDLYSIPDTSTGYVRRDVMNALHSYNQKAQRNYHLDMTTFLLLDNALRGGNCVVNRLRIGEIIEDVKSVDRCSAYTDSILNHEFPMGKWTSRTDDCQWEDYDWAVNHSKAVVMQVEFFNTSLKNEYHPAPYIDANHCTFYDDDNDIQNGRIISAHHFTTVITDVDFDIIQRQYNFKAEILQMATSQYGKLPECLLNVQRKYYTLKTELKGVEGQEFQYMKNKAKNNSIAGIFQQRMIKPTYKANGNQLVECKFSLEEKLEEANKKAYVSFGWGVWATAWARWELQKGIDAVGINFVYSDTDSIKYTGNFDFSEMNNAKIQESKLNGGVAKDKHNEKHYVGVWEQEKTATKFCMLGQKKYACCYDDTNNVIITVSGLDKELGSEAINIGDELGEGIDRFKVAEHIPFVFYGSAGGAVVYNDFAEPAYDDKGTKITSNVVIKPAVFTLGGKEEDKKAILNTKALCWLNV